MLLKINLWEIMWQKLLCDRRLPYNCHMEMNINLLRLRWLCASFVDFAQPSASSTVQLLQQSYFSNMSFMIFMYLPVSTHNNVKMSFQLRDICLIIPSQNARGKKRLKKKKGGKEKRTYIFHLEIFKVLILFLCDISVLKSTCSLLSKMNAKILFCTFLRF